MERFRGGHAFKAHRLSYQLTLGSRVMNQKKWNEEGSYCTGVHSLSGLEKIFVKLPPAPILFRIEAMQCEGVI